MYSVYYSGGCNYNNIPCISGLNTEVHRDRQGAVYSVYIGRLTGTTGNTHYIVKPTVYMYVLIEVHCESARAWVSV